MFYVARFGRPFPVYHTAHELKCPKLLAMERIKPGEHFIYHHTKSIDIRRLCRPTICSPEFLGIQQLRGHVQGRAAGSCRGRLSWGTRSES